MPNNSWTYQLMEGWEVEYQPQWKAGAHIKHYCRNVPPGFVGGDGFCTTCINKPNQIVWDMAYFFCKVRGANLNGYHEPRFPIR